MDEAADRFRSSVGMAGGCFQFTVAIFRSIRGPSETTQPPYLQECPTSCSRPIPHLGSPLPRLRACRLRNPVRQYHRSAGRLADQTRRNSRSRRPRQGGAQLPDLRRDLRHRLPVADVRRDRVLPLDGPGHRRVDPGHHRRDQGQFRRTLPLSADDPVHQMTGNGWAPAIRPLILPATKTPCWREEMSALSSLP